MRQGSTHTHTHTGFVFCFFSTHTHTHSHAERSAYAGWSQVGDIVARHRGDVAALTAELLPPLCRQLRGIAAAGAGPEAAEAAAALEAPAGAERVVAALVEYSVSISSAVPSRDMALAEFRWRNGALLDMGPTPLHVSWLRRAGVPAELLEGHGVAARAEPEVAG